MKSDDPAANGHNLPLTTEDTFEVQLETASGSRYRVTWDAEGQHGSLTRHPSTQGVEHPMSQPLRRDGETLPLLDFDRIDLGHPTTFELDLRGDSISTYRWANPAVSIQGTAWDTNDVDRADEPDSAPLSEAETTDGASDAATGDIIAVANGMLRNVHHPRQCAEQPWGCWIHSPLPHPLDKAPVRWRVDIGTAERVCGHGIGHPDPQDAAFWWNAQHRDVTIHGCDGCCGSVPEWAVGLLPER